MYIEFDYNGLINGIGQFARYNLRKAVRYKRNDIKAELIGKSLFHSAKPFDVELRDISTRGAHLVSPRTLSVNAVFTLKLRFKDGKIFQIKGKVMHKKSRFNGAYGFKFDAYNDALGDHLLDTQTDLFFS